MKVQILGTGCKKCNDLYANAEKAITETGATAELEKVTDLAQIMQFGVMNTPAIAIDGQVKATGKVSTIDEIKQMIQ